MKVVFASDSFLPVKQGITTHMVMYARELVAHGHQVLILAPEYPEGNEEISFEGIEVKRFPSWSVADIFKIEHGDDRFVNPFKKKPFFDVLDAFVPDIVHVHTEFAMGMIAMSYAKKRKIPLVATAHIYLEYYLQFYFGYLPRWVSSLVARMIQYHFFKRANILISPTKLMKKKLKEYGIKQEIQIVPTGMIFSDMTPLSAEEKRSFIDKYPFFENPVVLFVGRLVKEKNIYFLLDAFTHLAKDFPDLQLVYVGRGQEHKNLMKEIEKRGFASRVHIIEAVPREELRYFYHSSKIFGFPSLGETQGLVVLEAMACKIPVVGIDAMGVGETMEHQHIGGFLAQENLPEYAGYIRQLLENPQVYQAKQEEAFKLAKKWSLSEFYPLMEQVYFKVIKAFEK